VDGDGRAGPGERLPFASDPYYDGGDECGQGGSRCPPRCARFPWRARRLEAVGRFFERRQRATSIAVTLMAAYVVLADALAVSSSRGFSLLRRDSPLVFAACWSV